MFICIDEGTDDKINMNIEDEMKELYPWVVLNLDEIGVSIAYTLFDAEYLITEEILDEEINDWLADIHELILQKTTNVLESNGIDVI